jgi:hypothetical protein
MIDLKWVETVRVLLFIIPLLYIAGCGEVSLGNKSFDNQGDQDMSTAMEAFVSQDSNELRLSFPDMGDALTTTVGLVSNMATEINPALSPFGNLAGLASIPIKMGIKQALVNSGKSPARSQYLVDRVGVISTCSNIMVLAGVALPVSLLSGIVCAKEYNKFSQDGNVEFKAIKLIN